ncbi:MAG: type I DNA topoisomerase [Gammaproteobacteria bacterium]|nr:type I DNA topoisomerase [Gammaproteobacteria bacterium]
MARSLVIVESATKAPTINRYLGRDYVVRSSAGHVRDLPTRRAVGDPKERAQQRAKEAAKTRKLSPKRREEYRKQRARSQLVRNMGVDPDNGWAASYEVIPGKEKVVRDLRALASRSERVYLATDLDREGEAIAWHLTEVLGGSPDRYRRVVFNQITKGAIEEAFANPGRIDEDRVNAQQARRFLDRVVGFELSPLLWSKVARGLSAGRVQSVAVRVVVEREREIRAFTPEEYWEAFADLRRDHRQARTESPVRFQVVRENGKDFRPPNQAAAEDAVARLQERPFSVKDRADRKTTARPGPPFITSTLQQAASTRLGFSVRKTMTIAQRLYEAGYITYMRTDSTNLAPEAVAAVRAHVADQYGKRYLPASPRVFASKSTAQEAHEAIRPTDLNGIPGSAAVDGDARRLYDLIWRQFVACQMAQAEYLSTTVTVAAGEFELVRRGRIVQFDGFTRVLAPVSRSDDESPVPDFAIGDALDLADTEAVQHFTRPPPRYGEASLVRELEKRGIGRPSTYVPIISTIQERGYVTLRNRRFHAERIGELVTDRLIENFPDLLDFSFTADMEASLDEVAEGKRAWLGVLDSFYDGFSGKLEKAKGENGMRANTPTSTDVPCTKCDRPMQIRTAGTGVFLGCSGYALPPKERCTNTLNLVPGDDAVDVDKDAEGESRLLRAKRKCGKCGTPMDSYLIDEKRKLHICGNNPDCPGFEVETGEFRIKGYEGPVIECDKCGADMQLRSGRFGKYFGCTAEDCTNTRKLLRSGQPAPPKADPVPMPELRCANVDDHYVLRDGAAGIFLAASQFPKHRETRAPLVAELKAHSNELDPKFAFLLTAPEQDPDGNPTVVRFSRKNRSQYVVSEKDGKATKYSLFYRDGRWIAASPTSKTRVEKKTARKRRPAGKRGSSTRPRPR